MIFSKRLAIALISSIVLVGCNNSNSIESAEKPVVVKNVLTGLPGENSDVYAVKFDDTRYARPQQGIESADVVFVTQVEAGLTRLMGIFSSNYPELVGPVRSARISDIDILAQFGRVGFMYSGSQAKMRPVLASANLVNLSAERNPPTIYVRDPARTPPYAMMVRMRDLIAKTDGVDTVKEIGWSHGKLSSFAVPIESVKISWPNAGYEAVWEKKSKKFLLNFNGQPDFGADGVQLGSSMMVIQLIEITPSEFGDKFGGITPKSHVVGSGIAYLLRGGTMTKVSWKRPDPTSPTEWLLPDGKPANFATGQVWFFLTDREPIFAFPPPPKDD